MKKHYLTPTTIVIALNRAFHLLQQHSVNSFIKEKTRYLGDADEDNVQPTSSGSRYIGDIDEE